MEVSVEEVRGAVVRLVTPVLELSDVVCDERVAVETVVDDFDEWLEDGPTLCEVVVTVPEVDNELA